MTFHIDLLFKFIFELFSNNFNPSDISESLIYSVSPFQWSSTFSQPSTLPLILVMTSDTFVAVFFSTPISLLNFLFSLKSSSPFITIFLFFLFFDQFNSQIINFIKTVQLSFLSFSIYKVFSNLNPISTFCLAIPSSSSSVPSMTSLLYNSLFLRSVQEPTLNLLFLNLWHDRHNNLRNTRNYFPLMDSFWSIIYWSMDLDLYLDMGLGFGFGLGSNTIRWTWTWIWIYRYLGFGFGLGLSTTNWIWIWIWI